MSERRGVITAGTWVLDLNKTVAAWPIEDSENTYLLVDHQGGGSGCNMAIDLRRLDPNFPIETMGLVGDDSDGRFLRDECVKFGIAHSRLKLREGAVTPFSDCINSLASGLRTHIYFPGRRRRNDARRFQLRRRRRPHPAPRPARRARQNGRAVGRGRNRMGDRAQARAGGRAGHQPRDDVDDARKTHRIRPLVRAPSRPHDRQRLRDRRLRRHRDARREGRRSPPRSKKPCNWRCAWGRSS